MLTLGINYGSHDSSAALAVDGQIGFAVAEERLRPRKHGGAFPLHAISACLDHVRATVGDLDEVAFGWQRATATRSADLRNYLIGVHPMTLREVIRDQTVGRIEQFQRDGERLFHRHFGVTKKPLK